jgi:rhomboid protease GluP
VIYSIKNANLPLGYLFILPVLSKLFDAMANPQRQSILCPNCKKLISASEPECPFCGTARPASWWKNNPWTRGFRDSNQFVKILIAINVGMYMIAILLNPRAAGLSLNPLTFLSPSDASLLLLGATGTVPIDKYHRLWTLVSASFLHGGLLHIFFNMAALRQLAAVVNREFGVYRMFVIYTVSGIVGFLISYLAGIAFTIGASASVCGLIGAVLYYGKSRGGIYGRRLYRQVATWVVFLGAFGLMVPGINNWGHGGGILAGIVAGFVLGYQEKKRENIIHKIFAAGCVMVTLGVLIWAVGTSVYYRLTM